MRTTGHLAGHRRTAAAAVAVGVAGAACVGSAVTPGWSATGVLVVTPSPVYAAAAPDLVAARALAGRTPRLPAGATLDVTADGPVLRVAVTARDAATAVRTANAVAADGVPAALRAQVAEGLRNGRAAAGTPAAPVAAADVAAAVAEHGLAVTMVRRATAATPVAGRTVRAVAVVRLDGLPGAAPSPAEVAGLLATALSGRDALRAVVGEREATLAVRAEGPAVRLVAAAGVSRTAEEVARDAMADARGPLTRVLRANGLPDGALTLQSLSAPVPVDDPVHVPGWLLGLLAAAGAATVAGAVLDSRERRRLRERAGRRERRAAVQPAPDREPPAAPAEPAWSWSPVRLSEWQGDQPPVVDVGRGLPPSMPPEPLRPAPDVVPAGAPASEDVAADPAPEPVVPLPAAAGPEPVVTLPAPAAEPVVTLPGADAGALPPATGPVRVVDLRSRIFGGEEAEGERLAVGPDGRADLWSDASPAAVRPDGVPGLLRVVPPPADGQPAVAGADDTPTGLTRPVTPAAPSTVPSAVQPVVAPAAGPRSADPTALPTLPPVLVAPPAPFAPAQRSAPFGRPVPPTPPPFRPVQRPGAGADVAPPAAGAHLPVDGPHLPVDGPHLPVDGPRPLSDGPRPLSAGPRPLSAGPRPPFAGPRPLDTVRPLDTARPLDRPGASTPWAPSDGPATAAWAPVAPQPVPVVPAPSATAMPGVTVLPGGTSAGGAGSSAPGPAAARPDAAGPGADPAWSDILGAGGPPPRPQRPSRFRGRR